MGDQSTSRATVLGRIRPIRRILAPALGLTALLGVSGLAIGVSPASAIPLTCTVFPGSNSVTNGTSFQNDLSDSSCGTIFLNQGTYQGQFVTNHNVNVTGAFQETTILNGGAAGTVFTNINSTVTLYRLTITNGFDTANNSDAGGIDNAATLTLNVDNVTLNKDNVGLFTAGGIFNSGTLNIINNTSVTRNTATGADCTGGIFNTDGTLSISGNSIVSQNSCSGLNGTGGIQNIDCSTVLIHQSTISDNSAPDAGTGGGIYNYGIIWMYGAAVTGNTAGSSGEGGDGGGLFSTTFHNCPTDGNVNVYASLFANNKALDPPALGVGEGGAIYLQDGALLNMSGPGGIDNNFASECGGGIYVQNGATGSLNETTIQSNFAGSDGGGIYDEAFALNLSGVNLHNNVPDNDDGGGPC